MSAVRPPFGGLSPMAVATALVAAPARRRGEVPAST